MLIFFIKYPVSFACKSFLCYFSNNQKKKVEIKTVALLKTTIGQNWIIFGQIGLKISSLFVISSIWAIFSLIILKNKGKKKTNGWIAQKTELATSGRDARVLTTIPSVRGGAPAWDWPSRSLPAAARCVIFYLSNYIFKSKNFDLWQVPNRRSLDQ